MPDKDGYPTEHELDLIESYEVLNTLSAHDLMKEIKSLWAYADCGYWNEKKIKTNNQELTLYRISTAGWSGNENIIESLRKNKVFWMMFWVESRRGGHYKFRIKW